MQSPTDHYPHLPGYPARNCRREGSESRPDLSSPPTPFRQEGGERGRMRLSPASIQPSRSMTERQAVAFIQLPGHGSSQHLVRVIAASYLGGRSVKVEKESQPWRDGPFLPGHAWCLPGLPRRRLRVWSWKGCAQPGLICYPRGHLVAGV